MIGCGGGGSGPSTPPPPNPLYVSATRGLDTYVGDYNHPLQSIYKAAQIALDNYFILVGSGIYTEGVTTERTGVVPQNVKFIADVSGVLTGDAPGPVVIDVSPSSLIPAGFDLSNTGCTGGVSNFENCSVIAGFEIIHATDAGIVLKHGSNGFIIQNCTIHDGSGGADGIRVQDSADVVVLNNLVYSNPGVGIGIVGNGAGSPNAHLFSNTVADNGDHGIVFGTATSSTSVGRASPGGTVENDIVQGNAAGAINIKVTTNPRSDVGYQGDYNLVSPPTYEPATSGVKGKHDIGKDAAFVNVTAGDFHLQSRSPALNAGTALDLPGPESVMLKARTTTGVALDSGLQDLGFHYCRTLATCPVSWPFPIPTPQLQPTPTSTPVG